VIQQLWRRHASVEAIELALAKARHQQEASARDVQELEALLVQRKAQTLGGMWPAPASGEEPAHGNR
jgi:hypothetical protein